MNATISRAAMDAVLAHAASDPGREVCGLLLGTPISRPFALSLSKGCPSSPGREVERTGLRQAQPERGEGEREEGSEEERGGGRERIAEAVATANIASDPARRFEVDPAALFAAVRAERGGGPRLLGHYHSHPSGDASPSPRDAAMTDVPGRLWLIVAGGEVRCWRETPGGSVLDAFEPCMLHVENHCA